MLAQQRRRWRRQCLSSWWHKVNKLTIVCALENAQVSNATKRIWMNEWMNECTLHTCVAITLACQVSACTRSHYFSSAIDKTRIVAFLTHRRTRARVRTHTQQNAHNINLKQTGQTQRANWCWTVALVLLFCFLVWKLFYSYMQTLHNYCLVNRSLTFYTLTRIQTSTQNGQRQLGKYERIRTFDSYHNFFHMALLYLVTCVSVCKRDSYLWRYDSKKRIQSKFSLCARRDKSHQATMIKLPNWKIHKCYANARIQVCFD